MNRSFHARFLLAALFFATPAYSQPPTSAMTSGDWKIVDLGTLGGNDTYAQAINNKGWVVGYIENPEGRTRAFLWRDGIMEDLLGLPETQSAAWNLNENGQVVGMFKVELSIAGGDEGSIGFIWENGLLRKVALGTRDTTVYAINSRDVVGDGGCDPVCGFRFSARRFTPREGLVRILDVGGDDLDRSARDINRKGQIVGTAFSEEGELPYVWHRHTGFIELDVGKNGGFATGINDRGQVVGWIPGSNDRAFLWTEGEVVELGAGRANDINNRGQVVGNTMDRFSVPKVAWLWDKKGSQIELKTLGGCCASATGINEKGQIAGWSETADGKVHAVLWMRKAKKGYD